MNHLSTDPILSCEDSLAFERTFFGGDEEHEWQVMNRAGEGIGDAMLRDMRELRTIPPRLRILALVGKGHNGGDAILATKRFLRTIPTARAVILSVTRLEDCRTLTQRAWKELMEFAEKRVEFLDPDKNLQVELENACEEGEFHGMIDGFLGMQAKLPLREPMPSLIRWINRTDKICVRVSVDLPTGVTDKGTEDSIRADFTYCTGIVKEPILKSENAEFVGRIRYLDLGFFREDNRKEINRRVLKPNLLKKLRQLRPVGDDKRSQGHLFLLAGSRQFAGAAMMAAQGALKSGIGLLTVGIPSSLHSSFAAQLPEAMWIPLPESPDGSIALESLGLIRSLLSKVTGIAVGPGLGPEKETSSLIRDLCSFFDGPILLDADAIRPEILKELRNQDRIVLTPHAGEFLRISNKKDADQWIAGNDCTLVLKGPHTRILTRSTSIFCPGGSSVLARGGSGDILTGILGALLAKKKNTILEQCCLAVQWHGRAAEALARQHGQESVRITEILNYLSFATRNDF